MIFSNASEVIEVDKDMLVTLSLLMPDVPVRSGNVIPCAALEGKKWTSGPMPVRE